MYPLTKMNEQMLAGHHSLSPDDDCYYMLEYTTEDSFPYTLGNTLITNLKKKPDRKQTLEWSYKEWTIRQLATELTAALSTLIDFATTTIIPIPPSKTRSNPQYDDRVLQVIRSACPAVADIRESIACREDHAPAHESDERDRPGVDQLMTNYIWVDRVQPTDPAAPPDAAAHPHTPHRPNIVLFDDVIASGNHFTACKRFLLRYHPATHITGIFIARVIKKNETAQRLS
jgi:hypothetical protein